MRAEINYQELKLNKTSPEPLHMQLSKELHRQIRLLKPNANAKLLSERKLSELLALDRSTTHRAYSELKKAGLLSKGPNKTLCVASDIRRKLRQPFPNIGIVIPERFSDFIDHNQQISMRYLRGIFDRAAELNISTLMVQLPPPDMTEEHMQEFLQSVIGRLSGVIHLGDRKFTDDHPLQQLFEYTEVPQVFISGYPDYSHIGAVVGDSSAGAVSLCEHLRETGHNDIGLVSFLGSPDGQTHPHNFHYECDTRCKTMLECFQRYGLNCPEEWQLYNCGNRRQIKITLEKLQTGNRLPTVFWCINDETAYMTIEALKELGLRVPEDISVVGYDGEGTGAGSTLTTIKLPFYAIGSKSVDLLQEYYEKGMNEENRMVKLPTSLVLGNSLGPATRKPLSSIFNYKEFQEINY